jgi:hypothetical protein
MLCISTEQASWPFRIEKKNECAQKNTKLIKETAQEKQEKSWRNVTHKEMRARPL